MSRLIFRGAYMIGKDGALCEVKPPRGKPNKFLFNIPKMDQTTYAFYGHTLQKIIKSYGGWVHSSTTFKVIRYPAGQLIIEGINWRVVYSTDEFEKGPKESCTFTVMNDGS